MIDLEIIRKLGIMCRLAGAKTKGRGSKRERGSKPGRD